MGISHIRCREIMYHLWGNHVIIFTGKLSLKSTSKKQRQKNMSKINIKKTTSKNNIINQRQKTTSKYSVKLKETKRG